jgi:hypothetical protein
VELQLALDQVRAYEQAKHDEDEWDRIYTERREAILAYVKPDLEALDAEMILYLESARKRRAVAESAAKSAVLEMSETVRGEEVMFVWSKGKTTWDGGKLDGMASIIPQLNDAKKVGEPSVSIRAVK